MPTVTSNEHQVQPLQVLLIEDNAADAALAVKAIRSFNSRAHVTVATHAGQALALLQAEINYDILTIPDIILLDMQLPDMSGKELLLSIRAHYYLQAVPVVVLTSSLAHTDMIKSQHLDVQGYMVKPVSIMHQVFLEELLNKRSEKVAVALQKEGQTPAETQS